MVFLASASGWYVGERKDGGMNQMRPNEAPMPDPLAIFLTWTTYGTWLPGDDRGWIEYRHGWKLADEARHRYASARMTEDACILTSDQRELVETTVHEHCEIRNWELFAVNCRTNHIHVVVAGNRSPKEIRGQLKSWCTRRLKEQQRDRGVLPADIRDNWWAERGSARHLNDSNSLEAAIRYVRDAQDSPVREY